MRYLSLRNILICIVLIVIGGIGLISHSNKNTSSAVNKNGNVRDLSDSYQAKEEISIALSKLQQGEEAAIIGRNDGTGNKVALTFDGMADSGTTEGILTQLKKYSAKGTFFLEGMNAAENPKVVNEIVHNGQKIGNYGYVGIAHLEKVSNEKMVTELVKTQKVLTVLTDVAPNIGKAPQTVYTQDVLRCEKASGLAYVVQTSLQVPLNEINSQDAADSFVQKVRAGEILSFALGIPADIHQEKGKSDDRPAMDKQPGLKELANSSEKIDLPKSIGYVLTALQKTGFETVYVDSFAIDDKKQTTASIWNVALNMIQNIFACPVAYAENSHKKYMGLNGRIVCTTERAVPFSFTGLGKENSVHNVLAALKATDSRGTFFVTDKEIKKHKALLKEIIAQKNEVGIAILPKAGDGYNQVKSSIEGTRNLLQKELGVSTNLVRQFSGAVLPDTLRAIDDENCIYIDSRVNVVQNRHKDAQNADEVMKDIFGAKAYAVGRGWIIQIRMDYYKNEQLAADMILSLKRKKIDNIAYVSYTDSPANNQKNDSAYAIKPVGSVLYNDKYTWSYPVTSDRMLPAAVLKKPNFDTNKEKVYLQELKKRYIGSGWVNEYNRMLGFSAGEMRAADKSGRVHTHDNAVFFTFDDWGTDVSVNRLLYVFRKHNVRSNFCVLTHNVIHNPNLLRAIAVEGHDICAHTNDHEPMAVRLKDRLKQVPTQTSEQMYADYDECYKRLMLIAGDVAYNGKPVVSKIFRPPTLAVSRAGTKALFDLGYQYVVNGSANIEDYSAESLATMINRIKDAIYTDHKVRKGAVLVMHMSDNSKYTALALDALLTENEKKPLDDPSRFICGRLSDYLTENYDQGASFRY